MHSHLHRSCPVCDSNVEDPYWNWGGSLRLIQCRNCRTVYAEPARATLTFDESFESTGGSLFLPWNGLDTDTAPDELLEQLQILGQHCSAGRVLVVGGPSSTFAAELKQRPGYEVVVTGLESPKPSRHERRMVCDVGVDVRVPFLSRDFPGAPFDVVTLWELCDRLLQARHFLRQAEAVLRPGGFCLVSVENLNSLARRVLGTRHLGFHGVRVNYFTPRTLQRLAATVPALQQVALHSTGFDWKALWKGLREGKTNFEHRYSPARASKLKSAAPPPRWLARVLDALKLGDRLVLVLRKREGG